MNPFDRGAAHLPVGMYNYSGVTSTAAAEDVKLARKLSQLSYRTPGNVVTVFVDGSKVYCFRAGREIDLERFW